MIDIIINIRISSISHETVRTMRVRHVSIACIDKSYNWDKLLLSADSLWASEGYPDETVRRPDKSIESDSSFGVIVSEACNCTM